MTSRFISQPLTLDALQGKVGARQVINTKLLAIGVAEIKFGQITVKVLLSAVLIDADHASFEDAVVAFDGTGADGDASAVVNIGIFLSRMIYGVVFGELIPKLG